MLTQKNELKFVDFEISEALKKSISAMGFETPTEIQSKVIPALLDLENQDLVALAQTGSGKTAAFGIPLADKIDPSARETQALILSPTRELAAQTQETLQKLMRPLGIQTMTVYGGQSYSEQKRKLKGNPHVIIATPGRLVDLINQRTIDLNQLKVMVLDEADRMLSMGFEEDLQFILSATHPKNSAAKSKRASCQTWLFSATMSGGIRRILDRYLDKPMIIELNKSNQGVSNTLEHHYVAIKPGQRNKALMRVLQSIDDFYGIIFCQTKKDVSDVETMLLEQGISCMSLHGDKMQKEREKILKALKAEHFSILIATDVAARGIDVKNLKHVIHYSLPYEIESYIHRSGRTGRNGEKGTVISLIETSDFGNLNRLIRTTKLNMTPFQVKKGTELMSDFITDELQQISDKLSTGSVIQDLIIACDKKIKELNLEKLTNSEILAACLSQLSKNMNLYTDSFLMADFSLKPRDSNGGNRSHSHNKNNRNRGSQSNRFEKGVKRVRRGYARNAEL